MNGSNVLLKSIECERDVAATFNKFHVTSHPFAVNDVNNRLLEIYTKIGEITVALQPVSVRRITIKAAMPDEHIAKVLEFFEV